MPAGTVACVCGLSDLEGSAGGSSGAWVLGQRGQRSKAHFKRKIYATAQDYNVLCMLPGKMKLHNQDKVPGMVV